MKGEPLAKLHACHSRSAFELESGFIPSAFKHIFYAITEGLLDIMQEKPISSPSASIPDKFDRGR